MRTIHNHIYGNAVSLDCKYMFRNFQGSWRSVAKLSDMICFAHRLSVIQKFREGYSQVLAEKKAIYAQLRDAEAQRRELLIHRESLRPILGPAVKPIAKQKERDAR